MIEIPWSSVAFYIGSIGVRWYGILMLLAIAVLVAWVYYQSRNNPEINADRIWNAALKWASWNSPPARCRQTISAPPSLIFT
jgi:prolipoprotein diacylglyceryltransferase